VKPTLGRIVHFHKGSEVRVAIIVAVELADERAAEIAAGDESAYSVTLRVLTPYEGVSGTDFEDENIAGVTFSHTGTSVDGSWWSWPAVPIAGNPGAVGSGG
jgi:hypothetical protein